MAAMVAVPLCGSVTSKKAAGTLLATRKSTAVDYAPLCSETNPTPVKSRIGHDEKILSYEVRA